MADTIFDPKLYPRDPRSKFAAAVGGLKHGDSIGLPDSHTVSKRADSYSVHGPQIGKVGEYAPTAHDAADAALQASAAHNHPESLGGPRAKSMPQALRSNRERAVKADVIAKGQKQTGATPKAAQAEAAPKMRGVERKQTNSGADAHQRQAGQIHPNNLKQGDAFMHNGAPHEVRKKDGNALHIQNMRNYATSQMQTHRMPDRVQLLDKQAERQKILDAQAKPASAAKPGGETKMAVPGAGQSPELKAAQTKYKAAKAHHEKAGTTQSKAQYIKAQNDYIALKKRKGLGK